MESTLKTGVILANFKEAGKIEEQIASFVQKCVFLQNFYGMFESCTTLLISKFLISFITVFLSVNLGKIKTW